MILRISNNRRSVLAVFFVTVLLLSALFPLAVAAEETDVPDALPGFHIEPTVTTADDYTSAVTGVSIYVDNPDDLSLTLHPVDVAVVGDVTGFYTNDNPETRDFITVTAIDTEDTEGSERKPDFIVDFHKPADTGIEDAAYMELPAFIRAVKVNGVEIFALNAGYELVFRITGGDAGEDGTYAFDETQTYSDAASSVVSFAPERPQKFMAKLTQNEYANGQLTTYYYYPESILAIADRLNNDKDAFLAEYGVTDAVLYVQYDCTRLDTPSAYNPEEEADRTMLWGKEYLYTPIIVKSSDAYYFDSATFVFNDENFRARFPEDTFSERSTVPTEEEELPIDPLTYWQIDTEAVALTVRARFVLALTDADGVTYYNTSAFTDPFSVGASNSLVAQPSELRVPVLSEPVFESDTDGNATLSFYVESNSSLLEAAVWCEVFRDEPAGFAEHLGYEIDLSINGSDWVPFEGEATYDNLFENGIWTLSVVNEELNEYAYIRLRMRYTAAHSADTVITSAWSDALAFDKKPEETVTEPDSVNTLPLYTETENKPSDLKYVCPLCGICPAPWGVCLFLWIGAALLILLLIVLIIMLIPKKKSCPRCHESCKPGEKVCPVCGYRFVGSMPEIEDTTGELHLGEDRDEPGDDDFFAAMSRKEGNPVVQDVTNIVLAPTATDAEEDDDDMLVLGVPQNTKTAPKKTVAPAIPLLVDEDGPIAVVTPVITEEPRINDAPVKVDVPVETDTPVVEDLPIREEAPVTVSAPPVTQRPTPAHSTSHTVDAAFLAQLKQKMAAVKAGEHPSFTPAEIAYIRALKEKKAQKAPSVPQKEEATREMPTAASKTPASAEMGSREEQIARLRALREKQMAASDRAMVEKTVPRRVEKPQKQIKCPACAVPNPETNERCYICGGILPKE